MKEIKKEAICKRLFLLMNTVLIAEKNEEKNAQVNESGSKYTMTGSISMKDIFKYESRFSSSDEFDELW